MDSFEEIYERMLNRYNEATGNYPDGASDTAIKLKVLAGELFSCKASLEFVQRQMFIETASGEYLDYHGRQRGLERKQAIKARGSVTFSAESPLASALTVPKGTVVAVSGENPVSFVTDADGVIAAGESSVTVECTASRGGADGNAAPGKITVLVTAAGGASSVTNDVSFEGGADGETDEQFRKRICESIQYISSGANEAYYKRLALSVEGVEGAGVIPLNRGAGTVDVFICGKGVAASEGLVAQVQSLLDEKKEINTDVVVASASKWTVTYSLVLYVKDGYGFDTVKEKCDEIIRSYVASLGVGEPIYISELSKELEGIEGLKSHRFITADRFPGKSVFPYVSTITFTKGN